MHRIWTEVTEVTKTGWWHIKWDLTLEGEPVRFEDLSETTQEHIAKLIQEGYYSGEIVEEFDDKDCDYCCDECSINGSCERQEHMEE